MEGYEYIRFHCRSCVSYKGTSSSSLRAMPLFPARPSRHSLGHDESENLVLPVDDLLLAKNLGAPTLGDALWGLRTVDPQIRECHFGQLALFRHSLVGERFKAAGESSGTLKVSRREFREDLWF